MPEGHTLHRLARELTRDLVGQHLGASSPQGRFAEGARILDGCRLLGVEAYGKHLFEEFGGDRVVHVHLGLYGKFLRFPTPAQETRLQVRLRLVGDEWLYDLIAPTACELGTHDDRDRIVARLGPDPLRDDADPERAWASLQRRKTSIGEALLDQKVLAGVGNVYRAEALYLHGIHPLRPANAITPDEFDGLWSTLVRLMQRGVEEGRIVSVDEDVDDPRDGRYVYKQEACRRCGTPVRRWDLAGRFAYACESCQSAP